MGRWSPPSTDGVWCWTQQQPLGATVRTQKIHSHHLGCVWDPLMPEVNCFGCSPAADLEEVQTGKKEKNTKSREIQEKYA